MTKQIFLTKLREGLYGLPQNDIEERVTFYSEMIDDRMEEGISQEDAVSEIGDVQNIVSQILMETPITKIVKEKVRPKNAIRVWELILLILGSPIWLSLLIAAFAVVFAMYVSVWSIAVSLWAVFGSLVGCFVGGIASAVITVVFGSVLTGIALLGAGIFCGGLSIFMFLACRLVTKGMIILTKKIGLGIKYMFIGKGSAK